VPRFELSESVHLRPLSEADVDEVYELIERNRDHLARWMPWALDQTREGTLTFIRESKRKMDAGGGLELCVIEDGAIAGMVGLHLAEPDNHGARIGYWLSEDRQDRGLMTRAVAALLSHTFGQLAVNRVEIRAAPDNTRSRAIPERLGFVEEGVLREAERFGDNYRDSVVYSMLARDWAAGA
jgi:ribosomal-protein-serine acetyltransferase